MEAQDSVAITSTRYVLDGPGIKSLYGRAFSWPGPEVLSNSFTMGVWSFTGVKRLGVWC